jgi:hypothetical protein
LGRSARGWGQRVGLLLRRRALGEERGEGEAPYWRMIILFWGATGTWGFAIYIVFACVCVCGVCRVVCRVVCVVCGVCVVWCH